MAAPETLDGDGSRRKERNNNMQKWHIVAVFIVFGVMLWLVAGQSDSLLGPQYPIVVDILKKSGGAMIAIGIAIAALIASSFVQQLQLWLWGIAAVSFLIGLALFLNAYASIGSATP